jgi:hypothetical protein
MIEVALGGALVRVPPGAGAKLVKVLRACRVGGSRSSSRPVDFRKRMDGLAAVVQQQLRLDPFRGAVYVFRAKRADRVKLLVWDGSGLTTSDSTRPNSSGHVSRMG